MALLLVIIGGLAFIGSLWLRGEGLLLSFPTGVDNAFPVTDILVNAPASILAALDFWRMIVW